MRRGVFRVRGVARIEAAVRFAGADGWVLVVPIEPSDLTPATSWTREGSTR